MAQRRGLTVAPAPSHPAAAQAGSRPKPPQAGAQSTRLEAECAAADHPRRRAALDHQHTRLRIRGAPVSDTISDRGTRAGASRARGFRWGDENGLARGRVFLTPFLSEHKNKFKVKGWPDAARRSPGPTRLRSAPPGQSVVAGRPADAEDAPQGRIAEQGLRGLRPAVHLAAEMGARLGPGKILFRPLPSCGTGGTLALARRSGQKAFCVNRPGHRSPAPTMPATPPPGPACLAVSAPDCSPHW